MECRVQGGVVGFRGGGVAVRIVPVYESRNAKVLAAPAAPASAPKALETSDKTRPGQLRALGQIDPGHPYPKLLGRC